MEKQHFDLKQMRREYEGIRLLEEDVGREPISFFSKWFQDALAKEIEPNAMILATVGKDNDPDARTMLLKEFSENGFVFYTNYLSKKGKDLEHNPKATILFFWQTLMRQVRIFGIIEQLSQNEALEYFKTRPYESKVSAYLSKQSEEIENRSEVEKKFLELLQEFKNKEVPKPESWGGYRLIPLRIEFWQGRPARFHDRLLFVRDSIHSSDWKLKRLYP